MRAVVQRVKNANVDIEGKRVGEIGQGLLVFLGVGERDSEQDAAYLANKIAHLRIFSDEKGLMNLSIVDTGGALLVVSQFTLWADCIKGRRPSFTRAAAPDRAKEIYEDFNLNLQATLVATGVFQALIGSPSYQ
jgi:D-tyrosyl-tRNA(Tyr) deacylase